MRNRRSRWGGITTGVLAATALVLGMLPGAAGASPAGPKAAGPAAPGDAVGDHAVNTPPMGWNNWAHYQCDIDEATVLRNADALVNTGLADKGYNTVTVDDCWMKKSRDEHGRLVPDPAKFPHGMAWLGNYLHQRGLKFGIYEDAGTLTCGEYPGSWDHFEGDAKQFASWGVDYLKLDGCNVPTVPGKTKQETYRYAYARQAKALRDTGRHITFSQSAPAYFSKGRGGTPDWYSVLGWVGQYGPLWREGPDIATFDAKKPDASRWESVLTNYSYNNPLARYAGPGHFNDPDFLIAGDDGLTPNEGRSQIALWAMMSSPMILSSDVANLPQWAVDALGNPGLLAIDQDSAAEQGTVAEESPTHDVLYKPLAGGDRAIALFNRSDHSRNLSTTLSDVGLRGQCSYTAQDLWSGQSHRVTDELGSEVPAHGTAVFRVHPEGDCGSTVPTGQVLGAGSGQCLTASDGTLSTAACDGRPTQRAEWRSDGTLHMAGGCVTATGDADSGVAPCEPGDARQQWRYAPNGNLLSATNGKCLEGAADQRTQLGACGDNQLNQIWTLPA